MWPPTPWRREREGCRRRRRRWEKRKEDGRRRSSEDNWQMRLAFNVSLRRRSGNEAVGGGTRADKTSNDGALHRTAFPNSAKSLVFWALASTIPRVEGRACPVNPPIMPHTGLLAPNRASRLANAWPLWSCGGLPLPVGLSACEGRALTGVGGCVEPGPTDSGERACPVLPPLQHAHLGKPLGPRAVGFCQAAGIPVLDIIQEEGSGPAAGVR